MTTCPPFDAQPPRRTPGRARQASSVRSSDWYDFLFVRHRPPRWSSTRSSSRRSVPRLGTLAAFATFGVGFLFRPLGGFVVRATTATRLGRKRMLVLTRRDDGPVHRRDRTVADVRANRLVGRRSCS